MRLTRIVVLALALVLALPVGSASAGVWKGTDRGDDDLMAVRIDNAPRKVFLQAHYEGIYEGDTYWYVDTRRRNRGPEFRVRVYADEFTGAGRLPRSVLDLDRVDRYSARGRIAARRCAGMTGWVTRNGIFKVSVPRSCLKVRGQKPGRVRMGAAAFFAYGGPDFNGSWDFAPDRRGFGPWVKRG